MKRSLLLLLLWFAPLSCLGQQVVRPLVATEFGKSVVVTAEFIAKPSTYYSQNLVKEPFLLKVISVDGRALKEAVVIEYLLEAEKKELKKLECAGVVQEFEAYETLYQPAFANPWLGEWEQGMGFALHHLLHIRAGKGGAERLVRAAPGETPSSSTKQEPVLPLSPERSPKEWTQH